MKKILIIDSDVDFLNMMKGELEAAGYEVVVAQDAATGLAMTEGVSLIILAVELPDQNGFVVCSLLKRDAMTADTPVFITSSAETTEAFEKHLNLANHADGYFLKPVDVNALFQEMEALFEDQRLMQEATSAACDEMIDVNAGAIDENEAADNEVIKALSDEDMSLFGEIDSGLSMKICLMRPRRLRRQPCRRCPRRPRRHRCRSPCRVVAFRERSRRHRGRVRICVRRLCRRLVHALARRRRR